jgi:hypothetical protein
VIKPNILAGSVSPGLDAPRMAGSFPNPPRFARGVRETSSHPRCVQSRTHRTCKYVCYNVNTESFFLYISLCYIIKNIKHFPAFIYSDINTRGNWETILEIVLFIYFTQFLAATQATQFLVFPISTRVDITVYKTTF